MNAIIAFEAKYHANASGCWLWSGYKDKDGYGRFVPSGQRSPVAAHRFSWKLKHGEIPKGMVICHQCDIPSCVNPDHLFIGTQADNLADQRRKGRISGRPPLKTHCLNGHELNEKNLLWRLPRGYTSLQRYCRQCNIDKAKVRRESR